MNEPVTKELVIHKIKHNLRRLRTAIKWIIFLFCPVFSSVW